MKIILPKTLCELDPTYGPLFFLAGPVRGGDDWQAKCCELIKDNLPNFYAALPCQYRDGKSIVLPFKMKGDENYFDRQLT